MSYERKDGKDGWEGKGLWSKERGKWEKSEVSYEPKDGKEGLEGKGLWSKERGLWWKGIWGCTVGRKGRGKVEKKGVQL